MTCKIILNCIAFEAFTSSFSTSFVLKTLLYMVSNDIGYWIVPIFVLFFGIFLSKLFILAIILKLFCNIGLLAAKYCYK